MHIENFMLFLGWDYASKSGLAQRVGTQMQIKEGG